MAPYNNEMPKSKKPEDKALRTKNLTDASIFKFLLLDKATITQVLKLKSSSPDTSINNDLTRP